MLSRPDIVGAAGCVGCVCCAFREIPRGPFFFLKIPPLPLSYPRGDRFPQKRYIPPRVLRYSISRHFSMHSLHLFQRLSTAYVRGQDKVVNVVRLKEGESRTRPCQGVRGRGASFGFGKTAAEYESKRSSAARCHLQLGRDNKLLQTQGEN